MLRKIGIALIAASVLIGSVLAVTDNLGIATRIATEQQNIGNIHIANLSYSFDPNWWLIAPLIAGLIAGVVCVCFPMKRAMQPD